MKIPRVPDSLSELDQWLLWKIEEVAGKPTKVPYRIRGSARASTTDPSHWGAFEDACAKWKKYPNSYAGLGFVFTANDPFVGLDLDNCLDSDGNPKPWVRWVIENFADCYAEVSPSGKGLKIWAKGSIPSAIRAGVEDGGIEMYSTSRFFTVTGNVFRNAPLEIEEKISSITQLHDSLMPKKKSWAFNPQRSGRIPYGSQHSTLVSICGTLRARNVCDSAILACLLEINRQQCEKPGPPEHILRIVEGSRRWSAA